MAPTRPRVFVHTLEIATRGITSVELADAGTASVLETIGQNDKDVVHVHQYITEACGFNVTASRVVACWATHVRQPMVWKTAGSCGYLFVSAGAGMSALLALDMISENLVHWDPFRLGKYLRSCPVPLRT